MISVRKQKNFQERPPDRLLGLAYTRRDRKDVYEAYLDIKKGGITAKKMQNDPGVPEEYDFTNGIRGKYTRRYAEGTNVVVIDPDVAEYFPDHDTVNEALRNLVKIIKGQAEAKREPAV